MVTYFHDTKLHNAIMVSILTTIISWCYFFLPIIFCIYLFLSSVFDWSSVLLLSFSKIFAFKKCLELKEKIQYSVHFLILWTFLWSLNIKLEIFFAKVVFFSENTITCFKLLHVSWCQLFFSSKGQVLNEHGIYFQKKPKQVKFTRNEFCFRFQ